MAITVLLVDGPPVVRTGRRPLVELNDQVLVVGEAASGEEAFYLAEHLKQDEALCDLRLDAGIDGVQTTAALRAQRPAPAVIILTTCDRDVEILRTMEAARGGMVLAPEMAQRVVHGMRHPRVRLTAGQFEVLQLLETGAPNREIARELFVAEATVMTHLVYLFTKLNVMSRAKAVTLARETGILWKLLSHHTPPRSNHFPSPSTADGTTHIGDTRNSRTRLLGWRHPMGSHEARTRTTNNMSIESIFNSEELIMTFYFFSLPQCTS